MLKDRLYLQFRVLAITSTYQTMPTLNYTLIVIRAVVLGMGDGSMMTLSIADPEKKGISDYLKSLPSRNEKYPTFSWPVYNRTFHILMP